MPPAPQPPNVSAILARQAAWQKVDEQLNHQKQTLLDVNVQIFRAAEIYRTDLQVQEQRLRLQEEQKKQIEAQGVLVEKAPTAEERRLAALRSLNQESERQQQSLAAINVQIDRAAHTYADDLKTQEARLRLQDEMKRQAEEQGVLVEKAASAEDRRLAALRSLNQATEAQRGRLAYLQEAGRPERLQQQAALGKEVEEAERQHRRKLRTARGEGGALGDVGDFLHEHGLPGGKLLSSLQGTFNKLAPGLSKGLNGMLGDIGPALGKLAPLAGAAGAALGVAAAGFGAVKGAVDRFIETAIRLGSLASPGAGKRYELAQRDLHAVIGQRLVPVLELFTRAVRLAGDFLQTMLPSMAEVRTALGPLDAALKDVRAALAPIAHELKGELRTALAILAEEARQAALAMKIFTVAIPGLGGGGQLDSSVGAAPRAAHFGGVDEYAKSVYQAAYSSAGAGDPARQTADNTRRTNSLLEQLIRATKGRESAQTWQDSLGGRVAWDWMWRR